MAFATLGKGLTSEVLRSPDGKLIAVLEGAGTENSTLRWLAADDGAEPGVVYSDYGQLEIEGFSSDGRWLLASKLISGAVVIDTTSGEAQDCCDGGTHSFRFSANNRYLAYIGGGEPFMSWEGPKDFVSAFPLEPDGIRPAVNCFWY